MKKILVVLCLCAFTLTAFGDDIYTEWPSRSAAIAAGVIDTTQHPKLEIILGYEEYQEEFFEECGDYLNYYIRKTYGNFTIRSIRCMKDGQKDWVSFDELKQGIKDGGKFYLYVDAFYIVLGGKEAIRDFINKCIGFKGLD